MEKERNKTAIASSQPLITPGLDILKESWEIFKKVWKKFLGLLFVIPILSSLIWAVLMAFILVIYFLVGVFVGGPAAVAANATFTFQGITSMAENLLLGDVLGNILFLVLGLVTLATAIILVVIPYAVCFYSTIFVLREPEIKVWDAFKKGLKFFWRFLWVIILRTLAVLVGFILFIVPGIIFSIWFAFSTLELLVENNGGTKALGHSRELAKGFWWTIFARLVIIALFTMVVSIILNILNSLGSPIMEIGNQAHQPALIVIGAILVLITFIITLAVNYVVYSIVMIYKYLLYEKLKAVKQQNSQAVDGMNGGKKFGLSLVIIIPLVIVILFLSLIAMVGFGSFIKTEVSPRGSYQLSHDVLDLESAADAVSSTTTTINAIKK